MLTLDKIIDWPESANVGKNIPSSWFVWDCEIGST